MRHLHCGCVENYEGTKNKWCAYHQAEKDLGLDPPEKIDAVELLMKHYDPERYWRLQLKHRQGEP